MPSKKVTMRASMTNQTSHFGIMGGLYNRKISGRSSTNRVTSRLVIPPDAVAGLQYMKMHNLLSRNPLGSGGVGRMFNIRPRGSGLGRMFSTPALAHDVTDEFSNNSIEGKLQWKCDYNWGFCVKDPLGTYSTQAECESNPTCYAYKVWYCNQITGQCTTGPSGNITQGSCEATIDPITGYCRYIPQ